jgi:hypothetical protein
MDSTELISSKPDQAKAIISPRPQLDRDCVPKDVNYVTQNTTVLETLRAYSMHGPKEADLFGAIEIDIKELITVPRTEGKYCNLGQVTTGLASTESSVGPNNRAV